QLANRCTGIIVPPLAAELLGVALRADESTVERCLNDLSPEQKGAIELFLDGAARADIERRLEVSPNQVTETLRAAFRTLAEALSYQFNAALPGAEDISSDLERPKITRRRALLTRRQRECLELWQQHMDIGAIAVATKRGRVGVAVALLDGM